MASFVMETVPVRLQFITNHFYFLTIAIAFFIWVCALYFMDPAGPAARTNGGGRGLEGQERDERGQQVAHVSYRYLGTWALLRRCFRDGCDSVFGEGEENEGAERGEGNEEDNEDPSAWVVLKGRMVEGLRVGLAQLEIPLEWWGREWKGSLLLLGTVILCSLTFHPDISEPEDELATANQYIAVKEMLEMLEMTQVIYTYDAVRAAADPTATVIATRVDPEAGLAWETPFEGTLEDPLFSPEIWSDESWASAWAIGMFDTAIDEERSTRRTGPTELCSLLIQRCGTYAEDWESCGLEPIAPSAQTLERCMDFAARERRRTRDRLLSRSAEPASPSLIPLATST